MHVPHGASVQVSVQPEDGSPRRQLAQVDRYVHPRPVDGALVGEATFELPADLPLGWHELQATSGETEARCPVVVTPSFLGLPAVDAARFGLGLHDPAVRRAVPGVVGPRRPCRPARAGALERRGPRGRFRAGQPDARPVPEPAAGALAVPARHPALRQPALPARRGRSRSTPVSATWPADRSSGSLRHSSSGTPPARCWTGTRSGRPSGRRWHSCTPCRAARPGSRRTSASASSRATACSTSRPGARWPRCTVASGPPGRKSCATQRPRRLPPHACAWVTASTSTAGCSGWPTSSSPRRSCRPPVPACRWASSTTSPSASIRTVPTPGRCRT